LNVDNALGIVVKGGEAVLGVIHNRVRRGEGALKRDKELQRDRFRIGSEKRTWRTEKPSKMVVRELAGPSSKITERVPSIKKASVTWMGSALFCS